ncbi:energy transducer TonB [Pacificimonas sp. ICDLI1SI03]
MHAHSYMPAEQGALSGRLGKSAGGLGGAWHHLHRRPQTRSYPSVSGHDTAPSGFLTQETPRYRALAIIVAAHLGALAAVLMARSVMPQAVPEALDTFMIANPQPPAPTAPLEPVELVEVDVTPPSLIVAPPVEVPVKAPSPLRAVHRVTPPPPVMAGAAVTPPAPAAPPAAPAPVVPPDFSAAQLNNPGPKYPYLSRRSREEGVVLLRVLVTEEGKADEIKISESSGFERLDKAALKTVSKWSFLPAKQAGEAVAAWVLVPVTFSLS